MYHIVYTVGKSVSWMAEALSFGLLNSRMWCVLSARPTLLAVLNKNRNVVFRWAPLSRDQSL